MHMEVKKITSAKGRSVGCAFLAPHHCTPTSLFWGRLVVSSAVGSRAFWAPLSLHGSFPLGGGWLCGWQGGFFCPGICWAPLSLHHFFPLFAGGLLCGRQGGFFLPCWAPLSLHNCFPLLGGGLLCGQQGGFFYLVELVTLSLRHGAPVDPSPRPPPPDGWLKPVTNTNTNANANILPTQCHHDKQRLLNINIRGDEIMVR